jgi:hypothetical protein
MAAKSVLKHSVEHDHCKTCGACLLFKAQIHYCQGDQPIDPEVLEVFKSDTRPIDVRSNKKRALS